MTLPVLGVAGWSGSGKTTLLERLIPVLTARGIRVGVLKQTHHDFDIDRPGKDSDRLRRAGAVQTLVASPHRIAWIREVHPPTPPDLAALLAHFDPAELDLVLVEGFKHGALPRLLVHRAATGKPLPENDGHWIAVVSDDCPDLGLPCFAPDAVEAIAEFLVNTLPIRKENAP
ncbi:MAG: molybdopterin-guanine dinucleotide biosynthesis protein B [Gammaproteobacteria bacterium]|nr:MAG: molybdopterin-guanine dinucleotide biosynthesis protein B [Gammaproteobacteria bacterium]